MRFARCTVKRPPHLVLTNAGNGYRLDQAYVNKHHLVTEANTFGSAHPGQRRDGLSDHAALIVDLARQCLSVTLALLILLPGAITSL